MKPEQSKSDNHPFGINTSMLETQIDYDSAHVDWLRVTIVSLLGIVVFISGIIATALLHVVYVPFILASLIFCAVIYKIYRMMSNENPIQKFAKANHLQPLTKEIMQNTLPPFLSGHNKSKFTNGYTVKLPHGALQIFRFAYLSTLQDSSSWRAMDIAALETSKTFTPLHVFSKQQHGAYERPEQGQKLELEGDFNQYFEVVIPSGRQLEALEILTPDIMQIMLEHGKSCDFELYGNRVGIIAYQWSFYQPNNMDHLINLAELLATKYSLGM
jgi:hypothetical protein